ncbi:MAG TPA: enoyl-CoA hydratase-related protein [Acidimicrobiales bacterium]|nr:enoyl-CoA hydratase-related protein [Acidimicrobiales bacterium]
MSDVSTSIDGRVATITLDRQARRNAVNEAACDAIGVAVRQSVGAGAGAIVFTGAGGHFCSGADINEAERVRFAIRACLDTFRAAPVVTIAAVDGFALGAGVQFAAACDLRVATSAARFGVPAAKLGVAVDHTTVQQVAMLVGGSQARAMLLASEEIDGRRAYDLGFVNRIGTLGDAQAWAAEIAARAPLTIAAHKLALNRLEVELTDADVVDAVDRAWSSADLQEGRAAFAEKRTPNFSGN